MRLSSFALGFGGVFLLKLALDVHLSLSSSSSVFPVVATSAPPRVVEQDLRRFRQQHHHHHHHHPANRTWSATMPSNGSTTSTSCDNISYAFVIGGCNPEDGRYLGFFYNVLVAARRLRNEGSQADVMLLLQLSPNATIHTTLPLAQETALQALNVRIKYLPKSATESFYDTVLNKFRVLELTQYCRVMLLDADVMPLGNLDYLMQLRWLRRNVIVSGALEPANGGMFVVTPGEGQYDRVQDIISRRTQRSRKFDPVWGWGHPISPPVQWVARRPGERGTNWTFHFAFSDQGLLYHYAKYVEQDVSIIFEDRVENWGNFNGTVQLRETFRQHPFRKHSHPRLRVYTMCHKFLCDVMHFVGTKKPWLRRPPKDLSESTQYQDAYYLWWYTLQQLNIELHLGLDFDHWRTWQEAPLGNYATMPR